MRSNLTKKDDKMCEEKCHARILSDSSGQVGECSSEKIKECHGDTKAQHCAVDRTEPRKEDKV
jgi:hypothetical protein